MFLSSVPVHVWVSGWMCGWVSRWLPGVDHAETQETCTDGQSLQSLSYAHV